MSCVPLVAEESVVGVSPGNGVLVLGHTFVETGASLPEVLLLTGGAGDGIGAYLGRRRRTGVDQVAAESVNLAKDKTPPPPVPIPLPDYGQPNVPLPDYGRPNIPLQDYGRPNIPMPDYGRPNIPPRDYEREKTGEPDWRRGNIDKRRMSDEYRRQRYSPGHNYEYMRSESLPGDRVRSGQYERDLRTSDEEYAWSVSHMEYDRSTAYDAHERFIRDHRSAYPGSSHYSAYPRSPESPTSSRASESLWSSYLPESPRSAYFPESPRSAYFPESPRSPYLPEGDMSPHFP